MIRLNTFFFLFLGMTASLGAADRSVDLVFELQAEQSSTSISGRIGNGATGSDSGVITGTINATVVFDSGTLNAKEITYTGGRVFLEDLNLNFSGNVSVPGTGNFFMQTAVQSRNLSQTLSTISPPGDVSNSGALTTSQHQATLDQGTLTLIATVPGLFSETETTNYNTSPETDPVSGTASITISEQSANALQRTLQFTLTTNRTEEQSGLIEGTTTTLTLTGSENTQSKASISIPTGYGQWALDNSVNLINGDETNNLGFAYNLVYALGLAPDASTWPIQTILTSANLPSVELTLPTSGLNLSLEAEYRERFDSGTWVPLPTVHFTSGSGSLEQSNTGKVTFTFPEATQGFIRFKVRP
jgi:hypothetical protein